MNAATEPLADMTGQAATDDYNRFLSDSPLHRFLASSGKIFILAGCLGRQLQDEGPKFTDTSMIDWRKIYRTKFRDDFENLGNHLKHIDRSVAVKHEADLRSVIAELRKIETVVEPILHGCPQTKVLRTLFTEIATVLCQSSEAGPEAVKEVRNKHPQPSIFKWPNQSEIPVGKTAAEKPNRSTGQRSRKPSVNARMLETIQQNSESMGWNSPKWQKYLRCSRSAVVETETWESLESARMRAKAERMKDRHRKPKASDTNRDR